MRISLYGLLFLCLCYMKGLSQSDLIFKSSNSEFAISVTMPKCYGKSGIISVHRPSRLYTPEYSFDNKNYLPFTDPIDIQIGEHILFIKQENHFDIFDFNIRPNEDISFDFIEITPADCQGENGRISAAVTGSGTAAIPMTGSGTIFINSVNFGQAIDIPLDAGSYTLTAYLNEAVSIDSIVTIPASNCNIYFPNAINPNSDTGINKRFILGFEQNFDPIIRSYLIFDRWGSLIYKRENFNKQQFTEWWDGTCGNEPCQKGVYSYKVLLNFEMGQSIEETGTLMLL